MEQQRNHTRTLESVRRTYSLSLYGLERTARKIVPRNVYDRHRTNDRCHVAYSNAEWKCGESDLRIIPLEDSLLFQETGFGNLFVWTMEHEDVLSFR